MSLDRIGQALAAFYDDLIAEGVPEHLAILVRKVEPEPVPKPPARPSSPSWSRTTPPPAPWPRPC